MKIRFKMTQKKPMGVFYPFRMPVLRIGNGEVIEYPDAQAKKLLREYPENLEAVIEMPKPVEEVIEVKVIPESYSDKLALAKELEYDFDKGKTTNDLKAFLTELGYK